MKLKNVLMTLCLVLIKGQIANAEGSNLGLFVEPALTYELGTATVDYPSPLSTSSGSSDGFGLGAKFGFHISEAFFVALDGRYSMPQYKDSSVNYDAKSVSTNWGPVVGIQMPNIGLRIWGALILGGELNPEKSGSFDVAFKKASGYRIGTGFRISAISLNLEYQQLKYGETTLEQIGPFSSNSALNSVTLKNKSWIASVSFPLEL
ncbi:MAG: hypothetical protein A2Z20_01555 [Bdellovibrionales bacterium RBG_16_40_8]|nr:MAG: hypothetical protein A2Z20_01555 [Bdellovibrionales bacterium RBG_16_40_8]